MTFCSQPAEHMTAATVKMEYQYYCTHQTLDTFLIVAANIEHCSQETLFKLKKKTHRKYNDDFNGIAKSAKFATKNGK